VNCCALSAPGKAEKRRAMYSGRCVGRRCAEAGEERAVSVRAWDASRRAVVDGEGV